MSRSAQAAPSERQAAEDAFAGLPRGDLLLPYQRRVVDALYGGVSLLVIEKSRRVGLTWGLAAYAALRAAAEVAAEGMDVWYMGYDQDMAREFIEDCAMWARVFNIAALAVDEEVLSDDRERIQAFRIRFASEHKVVGLPSVPRALRGKQGLVIVDEAAFHGQLAEVLKSALALLMWGGQVVVVSTHDGVANPFNELLDDIRSERRKGEAMRVTFDDAVADGLYDRIALTGRNRGLSQAEWTADVRDTYGDNAAEELDCIPRVGSGSWLDPAALAACEHPDAGRPELYAGGLVFIGRDVARRRDLAVIHAYELVGDVLWLRDRWLERGATFAAQDDAFDAMFARYRIAQAWIDQTGMGEKVVEDCQGRHGQYRVKGMLLTGPNRLDLAIALKERVERCLIRIPPEPALRTDLRSIKKQGGISGSIRLVDDGEVHADEFWAAALACRAADLPPALYRYDPVARADRFTGPGGGGEDYDPAGPRGFGSGAPSGQYAPSIGAGLRHGGAF